jgi:transcriptional regulator with XRE-family HTH domain
MTPSKKKRPRGAVGLGKRLKARRLELGLSGPEFAARMPDIAGATPSELKSRGNYIYQIERGELMPVKLLNHLAKACGWSLERLRTGRDV